LKLGVEDLGQIHKRIQTLGLSAFTEIRDATSRFGLEHMNLKFSKGDAAHTVPFSLPSSRFQL